MPFKQHLKGRHHIPRQRHRVTNRRSKVEAAISRSKRVIGDALLSGEDAGRAREVKIAVEALNRMLELGRPIRVRVA